MICLHTQTKKRKVYIPTLFMAHGLLFKTLNMHKDDLRVLDSFVEFFFRKFPLVTPILYIFFYPLRIMSLKNGPLLGGNQRTQTKQTMRKAMMRIRCSGRKRMMTMKRNQTKTRGLQKSQRRGECLCHVSNRLP